MKLIVDIDEQHFELLQMAVMNGMGDNAQKIIAQGIPLEQVLEQIRDEIERLHYHPKLDFIKNDEVVEMALEIIDKHTKAEMVSKQGKGELYEGEFGEMESENADCVEYAQRIN